MRKSRLNPTDIAHPDYFHKVVDCQWACPGPHPVPEYIRLIAAGRYGDALPRQLGIECLSRAFSDAPATAHASPRAVAAESRRARRARASAKPEPVAICRLKRVAADYKDDIRDRLPTPPTSATASASRSLAPDRRR